MFTVDFRLKELVGGSTGTVYFGLKCVGLLTSDVSLDIYFGLKCVGLLTSDVVG